LRFDAYAHLQLVELMHGTISLQSKLDHGTIATFSVPFNKPQYQGATTPLVDIGPLPDRFQSELSLSCNNSSRGSHTMGGRVTPPQRLPVVADSPRADINFNNTPANASPPELQITEEQKKSFHILVVEDNAINQQIALKTIRNLGFSVSAVWNGKEALEYLLLAAETAQSPNPASTLTPGTSPANITPLPNIILMDVQMPILDGYRATHTLRHHAPFRDIEAIQKIPIVAMTASAIQGDREKCQRAGMDDYMAKPVKRTLLESMILKWVDGSASMVRQIDNNRTALERPDAIRCGTGHSSDCPDSDCPSLEVKKKAALPTTKDIPSNPSYQSPPRHHQRPHLTSSISEVKVKSVLSACEPPTALTEADRGLRRAEAEEQAANLRDDKLLAATGTGPYPHEVPIIAGALGGSSPVLVSAVSTGLPFSSSSPLGGDSYSDQRTNTGNIMALTTENVERFNADKTDDEVGEYRSTIIKALSEDVIDGDPSPETSMDLPLDPLLGEAMEGTIEKPNPMDSLEISSRQQHPLSASVTSKSREGRLSAQDRKGSDWSQSTAKPRRGSSGEYSGQE
jgi:CheY-like chemotaxis protein